MEYIGKDESDEYPGFFMVPGLSSTLINKQGQVIDLVKNWCPLHDINPDGYPCVNADSNRRFIHRLLALTFLPEPLAPPEELDVNHIDGVKLNFALTNLEWATRSANCYHAYQNGLRTDNVPVLAKDLRNGEIIRFYSLHECARHFKVDVALVHTYLRPYNIGKVSWKYFVLIREGQEWPDTDATSIGTHRNGTAKPIVAIHSESGQVMIFQSTGSAAKHFGWKRSALTVHMIRHGEKPYHGWAFEFLGGE